MKNHKFSMNTFLLIVLVTSIWVNISEVFRYFVIVMPQMHAFLHMVPDVATMSLGIFVIWGIWDMLLSVLVVFTFWLFAERFGYQMKVAIWAGTFSWSWLFVLFWTASANMHLAAWSFIMIPLILSWVEMVLASMIALWLYNKWN